MEKSKIISGLDSKSHENLNHRLITATHNVTP